MAYINSFSISLSNIASLLSFVAGTHKQDGGKYYPERTMTTELRSISTAAGASIFGIQMPRRMMMVRCWYWLAATGCWWCSSSTSLPPPPQQRTLYWNKIVTEQGKGATLCSTSSRGVVIQSQAEQSTSFVGGLAGRINEGSSVGIFALFLLCSRIHPPRDSVYFPVPSLAHPPQSPLTFTETTTTLQNSPRIWGDG